MTLPLRLPVPASELASASVFSPLEAQLVGNRCTIAALGVTGIGDAPCLDLCRKLITRGIPPATPLRVYRDDVLALRIQTIGEGAQLTVVERERGNGPRFERWKPMPLDRWKAGRRSAVRRKDASPTPTLPEEPPAEIYAPAALTGDGAAQGRRP
jgi:hypothetical protein